MSISEELNDIFYTPRRSRTYSLTTNEECQGIIVQTETNPKSTNSDNGKTMFYDIEGNIYEGELVGNKKHGYGKQIFINGDVYEGNWENGLMEGEGKLTTSSGDVYIGQYVKGHK